MPGKPKKKRAVPPAARVFSRLQADDALLPGETSALRRSGALVLALMVLAAVPFYLAANAAGLIGDAPAAIAKGSNSGPGGGGDDDDSSGPGSGDDDDDDNGRHHTRLGTDDTSANGHSTRGTTNDNDTHTRDQTHTRTQGQTRTHGQTRGHTQTRTGS
jgi:hypothetical protein